MKTRLLQYNARESVQAAQENDKVIWYTKEVIRI